MKRKPYSNCLLLLFQDFFQRFGINQTYSGLTKIRTRRRAAGSTNGTEPIRPVLGRLQGTVPFEPGRGNAVPVFVHPPYCVETPPGTRYNPPFNISENLFLTGQTE
ncbi:hypothetical protein ACFZ03_002106 [Neisseria gonorrhoeae]|uniref:hypothetical protein n=2 Tax=Neisseria gonorrhoeae TaxID=485 RepID=UPI0021B42CC8|nr:hypothetical protein [Neisseria gonorrhoeae]